MVSSTKSDSSHSKRKRTFAAFLITGFVLTVAQLTASVSRSLPDERLYLATERQSERVAAPRLRKLACKPDPSSLTHATTSTGRDATPHGYQQNCHPWPVCQCVAHKARWTHRLIDLFGCLVSRNIHTDLLEIALIRAPMLGCLSSRRTCSISLCPTPSKPHSSNSCCALRSTSLANFDGSD